MQAAEHRDNTSCGENKMSRNSSGGSITFLFWLKSSLFLCASRSGMFLVRNHLPERVCITRLSRLSHQFRCRKGFFSSSGTGTRSKFPTGCICWCWQFPQWSIASLWKLSRRFSPFRAARYSEPATAPFGCRAKQILKNLSEMSHSINYRLWTAPAHRASC